MSLPIVPLATSSVDVAGTKVEYRSLSRAEVVSLAAFGDDTNSAEVYMLARACSIDETEATAWREATSASVVNDLLEAIAVTSGLKVPNARASK